MKNSKNPALSYYTQREMDKMSEDYSKEHERRINKAFEKNMPLRKMDMKKHMRKEKGK